MHWWPKNFKCAMLSIFIFRPNSVDPDLLTILLFFVLTTHTASQCCCSFSALICMERTIVRFPEISALKISQKFSTIWFFGYFSGFWKAFLWGLLYSDGLGRIWGRKLNGGGGRFSFCSINFHQSLVLQAHYL